MITSTWIEAGRSQTKLFIKDNVGYMNFLITATVPMIIMLFAYNDLVYRKIIPPIENIPKDQKKILWETAKEISNGRLNKIHCILFSKVLYTLEYFLNFFSK